MKLTDFDLPLNDQPKACEIPDFTTLQIKPYLPIDQKTEFLQYITQNAIDYSTGTFSPLRVEVCFSLAIVKWYTDLEIDDEKNRSLTYDLLESNGIFDKIFSFIPEQELECIRELTTDTIEDITRFNFSAAGLLASMNKSAEALGTQTDDLLTHIRNRDGLEVLSAIKDMMGTEESKRIVVKKN